MNGFGKRLTMLAVCVLTLCLLTVTVCATPVDNCPGSCAHQAAVGTVHYDTLAEAVAEASSGSTVTLLTDISITDPVTIQTPLILDFGGKTLTAELSAPEQAVLHFTAVAIFRNGKISTETGSAVLVTDSTLLIEKDATLEGTGNAPMLRLEASEEKLTQVKLAGSVNAKGTAVSAVSEKGTCELYILKDANIVSEDVGIFFDAAGKLSMEDGTVSAKKDAIRVMLKAERKTELSVSGGKITSAEGQIIAVEKEENAEVPKDFITGGTFDKIPSDYIPPHSQVQGNTDGSFTVISTYTIFFQPGAGYGTMEPVTVPCGSAVTLPRCNFSAAGMDFAGWQIGTTTYMPGSSYTPTGNTTATALWTTHVHTGGSATCLNQATCSTCGASYGERTDHSMIQVDEQTPTCDQTGMKAHSECRFCGDAFVDGTAVSSSSLIIPALGHDWEMQEEIPATCQKDGVMAYRKCKVCQTIQVQGKDVEEEALILPKTEHQLENVDAAPATCVNAGVIAHQYCIHCNGLFLNGESVKSTDLTTATVAHVLSDWASDEHSHWKSCVDCQETFRQKAHHDKDFDNTCDECGYALATLNAGEAEDETGSSPAFLLPMLAAVAIAIVSVAFAFKKKGK